MKKDKKIRFIIYFAVIASFFIIPLSYAVYKNIAVGNGRIVSATWSVSLNQSGVENELTIIPGGKTDSYTLNVNSLSEVDISYDVVINNLPSGVSVALDEREPQLASNGTVTIANAGTILYNSNDKTNTNILTFSAANNATVVNNQPVTVNVVVKQLVSS